MFIPSTTGHGTHLRRVFKLYRHYNNNNVPNINTYQVIGDLTRWSQIVRESNGFHSGTLPRTIRPQSIQKSSCPKLVVPKPGHPHRTPTLQAIAPPRSSNKQLLRVLWHCFSLPLARNISIKLLLMYVTYICKSQVDARNSESNNQPLNYKITNKRLPIQNNIFLISFGNFRIRECTRIQIYMSKNY